jgi:O-antigen/teichoic acid export membrane protein
VSTFRGAAKNSAILMASQAITWTSTLVFMGALARQVGDEGFGNLFLAMSFAVIFGVLVEFGLDQQLVRAVARDRDAAGRYLANSVVLKSLMAFIAYGLILGSIQVLGYDTDVKIVIAVYCLILFVDGISRSLTGVFQAYGRLFHSAMGTIIEKVFVTTVGITLLLQGYDIPVIAGLYVVAATLSMTWKAIFLLRLAPIKIEVGIDTMRRLIIGALPFFLYWTLGSVYHRIDAVMLSRMTDAAVVGWYGGAYRLFDTLGFMPSMVAGAIMLPILSRLSVTSRDDLRRATAKSMNVMLIAGIPLCTGLFVLAEPIVGFVYGGGEFLNAAPALQLLALALMCIYINSIFASLIISLNQEKKMTLVAALAVVLNVGLNFAFIPQFGHVAAAGSTMATELFILGYLLVVVPRDLVPWQSIQVLAKAGVAAAGMAIALYALGDQQLYVLIPAGGIVYGSIGVALRMVPPEDIRTITQMLRIRGTRGTAEERA